MDAIVEAALRKWPNVPDCYGWLALDTRGDWYLRDDAAQAAGPFPQVKGSRIDHRGLREFIERNYAADARGCWYFQNGPQRVYVELEAAPWVWRLTPGAPCSLHTHTGQPSACRSVWLDELGRLFLQGEAGFGLVHSLDMELAARAVESGTWQTREMDFAAMPARFGYVLKPRPAGAT